MSDRKLNQADKDLLRLINRSPDIGSGWRQVGKMLWPHVTKIAHSDLTELDEANLRIRFTEEGETIVRYAL